MSPTRLEAYSDAVIAIIITIMVLELHPPESAELAALAALTPAFLSYVLSFIFISIYWNNHHHLLRATKHVSAAILWANVFLLFCLSLIPFTTSWMSGHIGAAWPAALYGINLLLAAVAYTLLTMAIIRRQGRDSDLGRAIGPDLKGNLSLAGYALGIGAAFFNPFISYAFFAAIAAMWLVPDRRTGRLAHH